jgi:hypothetical protein
MFWSRPRIEDPNRISHAASVVVGHAYLLQVGNVAILTLASKMLREGTP